MTLTSTFPTASPALPPAWRAGGGRAVNKVDVTVDVNFSKSFDSSEVADDRFR